VNYLSLLVSLSIILYVDFSDFTVKLVNVSDCNYKSCQGHEGPVLSVALDPKEEFVVGISYCIELSIINKRTFVYFLLTFPLRF